MSDNFLPDGTVEASSQYNFDEFEEDQRVYGPMIGLILKVSPSDDEDNLTSADIFKSDSRGWRHECNVLIVDSNAEPNLILENVVIPPPAHSGIDNFSEDLPRGLTDKTLSGSVLTENFAGIDLNDLNAEWCVVNFIGGSIDRPFIQNWWYHPRNDHDLATTGNGQGALQQVDLAKNKFRKFTRLNGVNFVVTPLGDCHLSTAEANSRLITEKPTERQNFSKGGNVQVDVKKSKQLEFNWNTPIEGLAAGSNSQSQSRDNSLPHKTHTERTPKARGTSRTLLRFTEYTGLMKTSRMNFHCAQEGEDGEFTVLADDKVTIMQGDDTVASITIQEGVIRLISQTGSIIEVGEDTASMATESGATVSILPSGEITISGAKVGVSSPMSVGGATGEPLIKGTTYNTAEAALLSSLGAYILGAAKVWAALGTALPPVASVSGPMAALAEKLVADIGTFVSAQSTYVTKGTTSV